MSNAHIDTRHAFIIGQASAAHAPYACRDLMALLTPDMRTHAKLAMVEAWLIGNATRHPESEAA